MEQLLYKQKAINYTIINSAILFSFEMNFPICVWMIKKSNKEGIFA